MTDSNLISQTTAAANAQARALKLLEERLWHFTSVGLGNCRAAQRVRREIECRVALNSATHKLTNSPTLTEAALANQSIDHLTAGLAHLEAVGLGNSRAAQLNRRELSRRLLIQSALLANANFNPNEPRDQRGRWTNGGNAAGSPTNKPGQYKTGLAIEPPASPPGASMTNEPGKFITNLSSSVGATINAAPIKSAAGFEEGLERAASSMGEGWAQLSDPGPLPDNFNTFLRAQDQALKIVPNPHFDPATGQWTVADPFARAMYQMEQQREAQREQMRAPGEAFSQAAGEVADQLGALKDALPGPKIIGVASEKAGEVAGYMAPSAIPYVGWATGAVSAGLASTGETFDQAFEIYKLAGYPEAKAREMARDVALRNGTLTGLIFALPVGRLAALPESALGRILAAAGISGTQLSADKVQTLLHAKASYNPNLTFGDIAREAGLSFGYGALFGAATHGAAEASKAGAAADPVKNQQKAGENNPPAETTAPDNSAAKSQGPDTYLEKAGTTGQWSDPNDEEGKAQIEKLRQWAHATGRVQNFEPPPGAELARGNEQEGYHDPKTERFYKRTYPPGTFGMVAFGNKLERIATPYFFLRRVALMNQAFGSDIRVEGITPGDKPSIITSQPSYEAADPNSPHPSPDEIERYMYGRGFEPLRNVPNAWARKSDGIFAYDTRPDNFIKTKDGVVPIDLVVQGGPSAFPRQ